MGSSAPSQKSPQCSGAAWFVLGLVKRQLVLKGIEFPVTGLHILLISKFSLFCSTLTFHREIRRLAFSALPQGTRTPPPTHKLTLIQSPGNGCLQARGCQRCVCMCVCVLLEVPSTTGVVTGPKFTQECVARGREVLWPPLTVWLEFQPPPSASLLPPSCSATYISQRDMCDDPHLLLR